MTRALAAIKPVSLKTLVKYMRHAASKVGSRISTDMGNQFGLIWKVQLHLGGLVNMKKAYNLSGFNLKRKHDDDYHGDFNTEQFERWFANLSAILASKATELASLHGHLVYYTPPYHPELQPMELIWADIKGRIADNPASTMPERSKIDEGFALLSANTWLNAYSHAQKYETSNQDAEDNYAIDENEAVAD
ncbi:uncharacterized protein PITG_17085 [Phytophthora infestans T30-4]|uniref:Tc1-like transposase DDE domain-containing protein n=1 Tax=Phytophthora infestans (strain T30-4) TaxID=403677 RepID=D0NUZ9_PHYIT|nr:uncharacterized protein PITG_17085 [Phytophthora infestans T30-4]EEY66471.1 conserved hypothetical protein [Phytophthora infestans T30-4]|eukprot:XP_002896990.1 conserved hypothetical protein [Phytophthora infestans T30-4]